LPSFPYFQSASSFVPVHAGAARTLARFMFIRHGNEFEIGGDAEGPAASGDEVLGTDG